jgi:hypothetical protein
MFATWITLFTATSQAAAGLIGLLFVSISVAAGASTESIEKGARAFLTPTLIHFASVIFLSLAALVPWTSPLPVGIILGIWGLAGVSYQLGVVSFRKDLQMRSSVAFDRVMYTVLPLLGFCGVVAAGVGFICDQKFGPAVLAGSVVGLLLSGIYGAWDLTIWIVKKRDRQKEK